MMSLSPWVLGKVTDVLVQTGWVSPDMDLLLRDACRLSHEGTQGNHKCPPYSRTDILELYITSVHIVWNTPIRFHTASPRPG